MRTTNYKAMKAIRECEPFMVGDNWLETMPKEIKDKYLKACYEINKEIDEEYNELIEATK